MEVELKEYLDEKFNVAHNLISSIEKKIEKIDEKIPFISEKVTLCESAICYIKKNCIEVQGRNKVDFDSAFVKIRDLTKKFDRINNKIYYVLGGVAALVFVISIIIKFV